MARTTIARLDGKTIGKRTSTDRVYIHVIIGQRNIDAERKAVYGYKGDKGDARNFAFNRAFLDGTSEFLVRNSWEKDDAAYAARCARAIERARESLGGAETVEAYVEVVCQRYIARFEANVAKGVYEMGALQWSMSAANAHKAVGRWQKNYINVRVIEAEELVKPAKAAKLED